MMVDFKESQLLVPVPVKMVCLLLWADKVDIQLFFKAGIHTISPHQGTYLYARLQSNHGREH